MARTSSARSISKSVAGRDMSIEAGGSMGRPKVTVVGAGNVGGTVAQRLVEKGCYDVVLVDIIEDVPQGKALDLMQAAPIMGYDSRVVGSNGYAETQGSSVVVLT